MFDKIPLPKHIQLWTKLTHRRNIKAFEAKTFDMSIIQLSFMSDRAAISKEMLLHLGRIQLLHPIKIDALTDGEGSTLFFPKLLFGLLQTQRSTPDPFA